MDRDILLRPLLRLRGPWHGLAVVVSGTFPNCPWYLHTSRSAPFNHSPGGLSSSSSGSDSPRDRYVTLYLRHCSLPWSQFVRPKLPTVRGARVECEQHDRYVSQSFVSIALNIYSEEWGAGG